MQSLKLRAIVIYNEKPNYVIEDRYYWELARTLAGGLLF